MDTVPVSSLTLLSSYTDRESDSEEDNVEDTGHKVIPDTLTLTHPSTCVTCDKLPVPDALRNMFTSGVVIDNRDEHDGRVRSFPHARGNWSSYLYVNYTGNSGLTWIADLATKLIHKPQLLSPAPTEWHIETEFHLSLSKTQVFKHHWIQPFISSISSKLKGIQEFEIRLDNVTVYVNEENTRTFISLEAFPSDPLFRLVNLIDSCLRDFELLPYYDPPSFHVTFAWLLQDQRQWTMDCLLPVLQRHWEHACQEEPSRQKCYVQSIGFRTGNKIYRLPLQPGLGN